MPNAAERRLSPLVSGASVSESLEPERGAQPPSESERGEAPRAMKKAGRRWGWGWGPQRKLKSDNSRLSRLFSGPSDSEGWQALGVGPQRN